MLTSSSLLSSSIQSEALATFLGFALSDDHSSRCFMNMLLGLMSVTNGWPQPACCCQMHNCDEKLVKAALDVRLAQLAAGLLFAGMGLISLTGTMPASWVADKLGRKWTIVPSCVGLSAALALMGATGACCSSTYLQVPMFKLCAVMVSDLGMHGGCHHPWGRSPFGQMLHQLCMVGSIMLLPTYCVSVCCKTGYQLPLSALFALPDQWLAG